MYCNVSLTETERSISVEALSAVSCGLSIVGAVVIFLSYMLVPEIRQYATRKLVMCLTIADLLQPLGMCYVDMFRNK